MEKIKSIVSGGHKADETTNTHSSGLSGEGSHLGQTTDHSTGSGLTGDHTTGSGLGHTTGPHSSETANRLDPNVPLGSGAGSTGLGGNTTSHGIGSSGTTTAGPHSSNLANKADPTVDSDRDGSHLGSTNTTGLGGNTTSHGIGSSSTTTAGPHSSNLANKADPTVDSDRSKISHPPHNTTSHTGRDAALGAGAVGTAEHEHHKHDTTTHGTHDTITKDASTLPGPAPNTAGPHKKDWLNKLDPRVDATGTKHKDHTHTGEAAVDHPSHSKGPAALGGPAVTASTAPMHNVGHGHRDESHDPLRSDQLGVGNVPSGVQAGALGGFGHTEQHAVGSEHHREKGATPLATKPAGTDLGDKLHGVERNRGPRAGDTGHHAGGEHSTHVGHGHTTGDHGSHSTAGHNGALAGAAGAGYAAHEQEKSTHHIGGETSSHVGHGHTGHHTDTHEKSNLSGSHEHTNLPATNTGNNTTTTGTPAGFNADERRGTTSGVHTDPAIHHVPAVGHTKSDV